MRPALADGLPLAPVDPGLSDIGGLQLNLTPTDGCSTPVRAGTRSGPNAERGGPKAAPLVQCRDGASQAVVAYQVPPVGQPPLEPEHVRVITPPALVIVNVSGLEDGAPAVAVTV